MSIIVMSEHKYKDTLRDFEASFEPQDWKAMQAKLQQSAPASATKRKGFILLSLFQSNSWKYAVACFLLLGFFFASSTWFLGNSSSTTLAGDKNAPNQEKLTTPDQERYASNQGKHKSTHTTTNKNEVDDPTLKSTEATEFEETDKTTTHLAHHATTTGSDYPISHSTSDEVNPIIDNHHTPHSIFSKATTEIETGLLSDVQRAELSFISGEYEIEKLIIQQQEEQLKSRGLSPKGSITARLGTGIIYSAHTSSQSPVIVASANMKVTKQINAGVYVASHQSTVSGYGLQQKKQTLNVGTRGTYHLPISNKIEVYAGLHLGAELTVNSTNKGNADIVLVTPHPNGFVNLEEASTITRDDFYQNKLTGGAIAGLNYHINGRVSAYIETSPGFTLMQAGVQVQLK